MRSARGLEETTWLVHTAWLDRHLRYCTHLLQLTSLGPHSELPWRNTTTLCCLSRTIVCATGTMGAAQSLDPSRDPRLGRASTRCPIITGYGVRRTEGPWRRLLRRRVQLRPTDETRVEEGEADPTTTNDRDPDDSASRLAGRSPYSRVLISPGSRKDQLAVPSPWDSRLPVPAPTRYLCRVRGRYSVHLSIRRPP